MSAAEWFAAGFNFTLGAGAACLMLCIVALAVLALANAAAALLVEARDHLRGMGMGRWLREDRELILAIDAALAKDTP